MVGPQHRDLGAFEQEFGAERIREHDPAYRQIGHAAVERIFIFGVVELADMQIYARRDL
jgi:hypothetical protein